jgi:lysophospholipase L1-like esterase
MLHHKILCLGDSLTQGYGLSLELRWTNLLEQDINATVINCGINGDTTAGMLARCERLLLEHKPTHLIVLGGTNDLWFGLSNAVILSNIHAIIRQARHYNAIPFVGILTSMMHVNEQNFLNENYSKRISEFKEVLAAYCHTKEQPSIPFNKNMKSAHFLEDGIHPNEEGQIIMKQNVLEVLKVTLERK